MALCGVVVVDHRSAAVVAHELCRGKSAHARAVHDDSFATKVHIVLAMMRVSAPAIAVSTR